MENQIDKLRIQMDRIENKIDTLIAGLSSRKSSSRSTTAPDTGDPRRDLTQERVTELERLFWVIVNSSRDVREKSYRFPASLLGRDIKPNIQGVILSVLVNQASLRKCFKARGLGDLRNESPADCAKRLLAETNLVVLPLSQTQIGAEKATLVAFSPGEAERVALSGTRIPAEFKGWSCVERAKGRQGPVGYIPAPQDPCGARVWGDVTLEEEIEDEIEEEEAPSPIKKLDYRSRVQFVVEDE